VKKVGTSLKITKVVVGESQTNCYLISGDKDQSTIIIDPGDDAEFIESVILRNGLKPLGIFLTHGHFDHLKASEELALAFGIRIYFNPGDSFLVNRFFNRENKKLLCEFSDNEVVIAGVKIQVVNIKGHTPGGIAFYIKENNAFITGDLIFKDKIIGRYDFKYSNASDIYRSIKILGKINKDAIIYPGHGDAFIFSEEYTA
jgi:hydroxyacylglutathione hydrolase